MYPAIEFAVKQGVTVPAFASFLAFFLRNYLTAGAFLISVRF